jgi:hypothetical protein
MTRKKGKHEERELPPTPKQCPRCGGHDLVLHGAVRNTVQQALHDGEPVGQRVARGERDTVWDRLSCVQCGAECERTDERITQLREEIERLEFQLAYVTGQLVPENRLPC